jgi:3-oxoacyl-[acyl-carrier-protein] synthase I
VKPLSIVASGMMTGVGLDAPSSCAAIRAAIDRFEETRFMDRGGEWIIGSEVPLTPPSRGREKLLRMAVSAVGECLRAVADLHPGKIALLLCLSELDRPGRFAGLDATLLSDVQQHRGVRFHAASKVITGGRVGGVHAVVEARQLLDEGCAACIVAGADTFLVAGTLDAYERKDRLLTSVNSNGFIPGEAGAAVLLGDAQKFPDAKLFCLGVGYGHEQATIESEEPLRADGLAEAFRAAIADAGCTFDDVDYRLTDINGEQYMFKESALAIARTIRKVKPEFDLWHPADCIGAVGAAIVPCVVAVARAAAGKEYAPGPGVLCHFSNDDGARAAVVLRNELKGGA